MFDNFLSLFRARMQLWLLVTLILTGLILLLAPQQFPVTLYKLSLVAAAGWGLYWFDRGLFPYARPDKFLARPFSPGVPAPEVVLTLPMAIAFAAAVLRRAIIIGAGMLAVALGA